MASSSDKSKEAAAVPHGAPPSGMFPQGNPVVSNGPSPVFKYPQPPASAAQAAALNPVMQFMQQMQQQQQQSNSTPAASPAVPFPAPSQTPVPATTVNNPKPEFDASSALMQIMRAIQTQNGNVNVNVANVTDAPAPPSNFTPDGHTTPQLPPAAAPAPVPPPTVSPTPQQILMAQTQAQAAAILAGCGMNPALLLNAAAATPAATNPPSPMVPTAAAQAFAALMQQQQQQQQQTKPPQPTQPTTTTSMEQPKPHSHPSASPATSKSVSVPQQPTQPTALPMNHMQQAQAHAQASTPFPPPATNQRFSTATSHDATSLPPPYNHPHQTAAVNSGILAATQVAHNSPHVLAQMQTWKLEQLEAHVKMLRDSNAPVPQSVSLLLAEARRREEKRTAKRVANRKSACTSRARKKALVEDLTRTNARLKRQAMILALLPDLVIAVKTDGEITFCSQQVERVLRRDIDSLIGTKISTVVTPSSYESLARLIDALVAAEQAALDDCNKEGDESGGSTSNSGGNVSPAAVVSEQSEQGFPMSVVKVKSRNLNAAARDESSEASGGSGSGRGAKTLSRSTTASSFAANTDSNSQGSSNGGGNGKQTKGTESPPMENGKASPTTGKADDSSSSSETKNLRRANESLSRNVMTHNAQMSKNDKKKAEGSAHKDDVTGASVTANNAGARLSSLRHNPQPKPATLASGKKAFEEDDCSSSSTDSMLGGVEDKRSKAQVGNTSEDSGYRESGESVPSTEDTSSSANGGSNNASRPRPLVPSCNICIIRSDETTIWCEVTSSIRTRCLDNENDVPLSSGSQANGDKNNSAKDQKDSKNGSNASSESGEVKELLLCLRPIREGGNKFKEDIRFASTNAQPETFPKPTNTSKTCSSDNTPVSDQSKSRPMKKRSHAATTQGGSQVEEKNVTKLKKPNVAVTKTSADVDKKIALESLILMSGHQSK